METLVRCAMCGTVNRPRPTTDRQRLACGGCHEPLPLREVIARCSWCKQKNRLTTVGASQRLRCAACKRSLPDPEILIRLLDVRDELRSIALQYRRLEFWRHPDLEKRLRKQEAIIGNLPQFPAFRHTRAACFDLGIEIDTILKEIYDRRATSIEKVAVWIFGQLFGVLHLVLGVPRRELPPGLQNLFVD